LLEEIEKLKSVGKKATEEGFEKRQQKSGVCSSLAQRFKLFENLRLKLISSKR
jgi:hypothetical protein